MESYITSEPHDDYALLERESYNCGTNSPDETGYDLVDGGTVADDLDDTGSHHCILADPSYAEFLGRVNAVYFEHGVQFGGRVFYSDVELRWGREGGVL